MSGLSESEISHLAKLARLSLSEEEKAKFALELPKIAEFVEKIQSVQLSEIEVNKTTPLAELRSDEPSSNGLSLEQLAQLAPQWEKHQNVVPPVFGGDDA